jgi:peroxiredoxin
MDLQSHETDPWVDERLATLTPALDWPRAESRIDTLRGRRAAQRARRLQWIGAAAVVVMIGAAVPVTRAFAARCLDACASGVAQFLRADEPLANAPKGTGYEIGNLAPEAIGADAAGRAMSLSSLRGHVVVVNFWATWCGPCRAEVPVLNSLATRFGQRGLDVIGISMDADGWPAIKPFVESEAMEYPILLGTDAVAETFGGVGHLPATFVIDPAGVIVAKMEGAMREGQYDALIERILR